MATVDEVKKLAALARIRIEDKELDKFTREFDAILAYVGQLEKLNLSGEKETKPLLRNVMRKDSPRSSSGEAGGESNTPGANTEKIVAQFPESKNDALVVKQIISHEEAE
jgi:aspartyl/glutamyl-tRNA(Asn/Gln) amidotransferase C subunit